MEIKVGDLINNRYVLKQIMLDPSKKLREPVFIMYDKLEDEFVDFSKKEMMKLLNIEEEENDNI